MCRDRRIGIDHRDRRPHALSRRRPSWWAPARRSAWSAATGPGSPRSSRCWSASPRRTCADQRQRPASPAPSATCPRCPCPVGSASSPTGFSHVLSARGLDVLDDALRPGPAADGQGPDRGEHRAVHATSRSSSGRTAATRPSRSWPAWPTASGCARSSFSTTSSRLSGGQRRRVDLIRVLFQEPDPMILDEPTNHLDLSAKRWLHRRAGPLRRRPARREPRPETARPRHHQGAAPTDPAAHRVQGQLLAVRSPARGRAVAGASRPPTRGS